MRPTPLLRWGNALLKLELFERAVWPPRAADTHEMRETLKLWDGHRPARPDTPIIAELQADLTQAPSLVVAPAGELETLLEARKAWPAARVVALVAADVELPDLPREVSGIERVAVTRAQAATARSRVARELGLLTSHASAAAAVHAHEHGGVAIVSGVGEHEFSIESPP